MYHFTFIDEASTENETLSNEALSNETLNLEKQETVLENTIEQPENEKNIIKKTAHFLHRYLDQPNCVRIYISKN